jgi:hypothetical protein
MKYRFETGARVELLEAIDFYNSRRSGLGSDFLDEVEAVLVLVCENPLQFALAEDDIRIARTKRFPYGLVFAIEKEVIILAVMHLHRRPGYWKRDR